MRRQRTAEDSRPLWPPGRLSPAYLCSSGISGLFLNNDEVLTHGFCSWFLPLPPAADFLGEDTVCARPAGALRGPPAAVFLAGREVALLLRFAGGTALDAWYFRLVACACCAVPKRKEQPETRQPMKTDLGVKPDCPRNGVPPCRDHYAPYVKQQFRACHRGLCLGPFSPKGKKKKKTHKISARSSTRPPHPSYVSTRPR